MRAAPKGINVPFDGLDAFCSQGQPLLWRVGLQLVIGRQANTGLSRIILLLDGFT